MNIFLTGLPGAGKSTILDRMLAELSPAGVGGFFTTRAITPESRTFWLHDRITRESCHMATFTDGSAKVNLAAFEPFALNSITRPCELLVLDELGRFEEPCAAFKSAVHAALDSAAPVLGVLKVSDTPFVRSIAERGDVHVVTVTEQTRDSAYREFVNVFLTNCA
jgi:nucleoside-triphosphatase